MTVNSRHPITTPSTLSNREEGKRKMAEITTDKNPAPLHSDATITEKLQEYRVLLLL